MAEDSLSVKLDQAESQLIAWATDSEPQGNEYRKMRADLMDDPTLKPHLPDFIRSCRSYDQFWAKMKKVADTYKERRQFIWSEMKPVFDIVENRESTPVDQSMEEALSDLEVEHVNSQWEKALDRITQDPEGALTIARTLLESVFMSLLDEFNVEYSESDDITNLYHMMATEMELAPSQYSDKRFSTILGNAQSVVQELASLRSDLGDAHGDGQKVYKPKPRHAEFTVNLAGSVAMFLVRTWNEKYND